MVRAMSAGALAIVAASLLFSGAVGRQLLKDPLLAARVAGYGDACDEISQCSSPSGGLACAAGVCTCGVGYYYDDDTMGCRQVPSVLCLRDSPADDNLDCIDGADCMDEEGNPVGCFEGFSSGSDSELAGAKSTILELIDLPAARGDDFVN